MGFLLIFRNSIKEATWGKKLCSEFEHLKLLKLSKNWLNDALVYHQDEVCWTLLDTLKYIEMTKDNLVASQLSALVKKIKKESNNSKVKKRAGTLYDHWKDRFKPRPQAVAPPPKSKSKDVLGTLLQAKAPPKPKAPRSTPLSISTVLPPTVTAPIEMPALPAIQSFNSAQQSTKRRIRWADDHGAELVKVKLIESRRELSELSRMAHSQEGFADAKRRELAGERLNVENERKEVVEKKKSQIRGLRPNVKWIRAPLVAQRDPGMVAGAIETEEVRIESDRIRDQLAFQVLEHEQPPLTPIEWHHAHSVVLSAVPEIPLKIVGEEEMEIPKWLWAVDRNLINELQSQPDILRKVYQLSHRQRVDNAIVESFLRSKKRPYHHQQQQQQQNKRIKKKKKPLAPRAPSPPPKAATGRYGPSDGW